MDQEQGAGSEQQACVVFMGGDEREGYAAKRLAQAGWSVRAFSLPAPPELNYQGTPAEGLAGARALVTPIRGLDEQGRPFTLPDQESIPVSSALLQHLPADGVWLCGRVSERVQSMAQAAGRRAISIVACDDFAILNAVPTAEGAVVEALQASTVTLHGNRALVLGFGRCGQSLAWLLDRMGGRVDVWVRRPKPAARAAAYGYGVVTGTLTEQLGGYRFIFSTVPAVVLDRSALAATHQDVVIVDIASAPGGTDFEAASRLKRTAIHALGIPGKIAPESAGAILADVIQRLAAAADASPRD